HRHAVAEEDEIVIGFSPEEIGAEDRLVADRRQDEQGQDEDENRDPRAVALHQGHALGLAGTARRRLSRQPAPTPQIDAEADHHYHPGRAEAVMPADPIAER